MEHVGALSEGEWSCSLSGMYNTTEEADFMAQLLANPPFPSNPESCLSLGDKSCWPGQESVSEMAIGAHKIMCSSEMATNPNMLYFLQGNANIHSGSFSSFFPIPMMGNANYFLNDSHAIPEGNDGPMAMEFCSTGDGKIISSYLDEENVCMDQGKSECNADQEPCGQQPYSCIPDNSSQDDKMPAVQDLDDPMDERSTISETKKRSRNAEKGKRTVRSRRNQKRVPAGENEEDSNVAGKIGQCPSACCSEDDCNASQEHQAGVSTSESSKDQPTALNSKGKSRASRGTATDPQSLYARKRRGRINERLRILQTLVPNGAKVDISTMLEEAVQYVKFLQMQIKLLSSDDLWMYAPIAYNGMNIGLDLNIPIPPKRP